MLAESYVGRYMTILVFSAIYAVGCGLTAVAASPTIESIPLFMMGILVLTAPGTGGVKPNIGTFGADQFDPRGEESQKRKEAFFMYLYVTMSVGSVIAFGFLANVATAGLPPHIPKEDGFFLRLHYHGNIDGSCLDIVCSGHSVLPQGKFSEEHRASADAGHATLAERQAHDMGQSCVVGLAAASCAYRPVCVASLLPITRAHDCESVG